MPETWNKPKERPAGGILLLHAWWGLNEFMTNLSGRLASEGYSTLAMDLYHGRTASTIPEAQKLRQGLKREIVTAEILDALERLSSDPALQGKKIGTLGFSLGAYWCFWLAEKMPLALAACVGFYGIRNGQYSRCQTSFMGHFADKDTYVSESTRKKVEQQLESAGKEVKFITYPGTRHWFFESDRLEYMPQAADQAWLSTLEFLKKHLT